MSGQTVVWAQADRGRGAGFGFAHLWWVDADDPMPRAGSPTVCGYDPARHNGVAGVVVMWRLADDEAPRCSRCEAGRVEIGRVYHPLGQHPADR